MSSSDRQADGRLSRLEPSGSALRLSNVTKLYSPSAPFAAISNVSLSVAEGARVAIMGPSGSGKSTLLNLIGGLDVPTSGAVIVGDVNLATLNEAGRSLLRRSQLAYIFQAYHLLPTLTCEQNVAMPLYLQGMGQTDIHTRVHQALDDVGLQLRASHLPDQLSGGERQRAAIARALVTQPRVLLADEPTGNLDSASGEQVLGLLREITLARRATLVMVTHNEHAARLCDRIVTLRDGRVENDNDNA